MRSARRTFCKPYRRAAYGVGTFANDQNSFAGSELEWPIKDMPFGLKAHEPLDEEEQNDLLEEEYIIFEPDTRTQLQCFESDRRQWCEMTNLERIIGLSRCDIVIGFEDFLQHNLGWGHYLIRQYPESIDELLSPRHSWYHGTFCESYYTLKNACLSETNCWGVFLPYLVGFGLQNFVLSTGQEIEVPSWLQEVQKMRSMTISDIMAEEFAKRSK